MITKPVRAAVLAALVTASTAAAQDPDGDRTRALTIYRNDLAAVTLTRQVDLDLGAARLAIDNLMPGAVPDSFDLHADGVVVRRQRYLPWPISRARLLQAAVGTEVTLARTPETGEAAVTRRVELLAVEPDIVVRANGRIETNPPGRIVLDGMPGDLPDSPTAVFHITSGSEGAREIRLRYLSRGVSWSSAYVGSWDREAGTLDLTGRARIRNDLQRPVAGDRVTLVAGEVPSPQQDQPRERGQDRTMALQAEAATAGAPQPTPEQRADLRLYRLTSPVRVPAGSTVSKRLLGAEGIDVATRYRVTGVATNRPVQGSRGGDPGERSHAQLRLVVPDTRAAGLDKALPAGTVHVYDGDIFRGAVRLPDTPVGTELALDLGPAVDVTATAAQTGYETLAGDTYAVGKRITIKNAKAEAVTVRVVGAFQDDWSFVSESASHTINDAGDPVWRLDVPPAGESTLTYRVRVRR